MKKTNTLFFVGLLLLTSCASHVLPTRQIASDGFSCIGLLSSFFKPKKAEKLFNVNASENAVFNYSYQTEVAQEFEKIPWEKRKELNNLFSAVTSGRMSTSAFKKIVAEFPETNTQVSVLIYKKTLEETDSSKSISEFFSEYKLDFAFQKETDEYYIFDFKLTSATDVEQFSEATSFGPFQGMIFGKNEALPSNKRFTIPTAVLFDLKTRITNKAKKGIDVRYAILYNAEEYSNVSYDVLKKIVVDYDGKTPLEIVFSVPKRVLIEQRKINPNSYTGDHFKDVEEGFEIIGKFKGKYVRLPESEEEVSFKITLSSLEELNLIPELFNLSVGGRISLP